MPVLARTIDFITLASDRPIRRLLAYYVVVGGLAFLLLHFVPHLDSLFSGEHVNTTNGANVLTDMLASDKAKPTEIVAQSRLDLALTVSLTMISTVLLMLPVSWVFMSVRRTRDSTQHVAQTLILLPLVVAGMVLVVRTSLALAFSLGGIVAGLRLRTTMKDVRDAVYMLLAIGVGLAAGVQALTVAIVLSLMFNMIVLFNWRFDFGRNVLEPTAAARWSEPLIDLADDKLGAGTVPDRDLVMAMSPENAEILAKKFKRVSKALGASDKKPRFNAVLSVTTDKVSEAQSAIEGVLDRLARRWRLDEVVTNEGKPSALYYMVGVRKSVTCDQMVTAVRQSAGDKIVEARMELGDTTPDEPKSDS